MQARKAHWIGATADFAQKAHKSAVKNDFGPKTDIRGKKEFAVPLALRTNGNGVTLRDLVSSTLGVVVEVLQLHLNHP